MDKTITNKKQLQQFVDNITVDVLLDLIFNEYYDGIEEPLKEPLFDVYLWNGYYDYYLVSGERYTGDHYYLPPEYDEEFNVETTNKLLTFDELFKKDNGEEILSDYFCENKRPYIFDGSNLTQMTYNPDKNTYTLYFKENYKPEITSEDLPTDNPHYTFDDFVVGIKGFYIELPADFVEQYL